MTMRHFVALIVWALLTQAAFARQESAGPKPDPLEIWDDPTFKQQFLGSYGFQAEIEPRVSVVEREQMEKLLPLLKSDSAAAVVELEKIITPQSSAVLDFTLGNVHFQEGRLEEAGRCYAAAIAKFPSFRRAQKNLGLVHLRAGRFAEAAKSLGRVIELGGADGLTYGLLGHAYNSSEQFVSAESAYRNAMLLQGEVLDWKLGLLQSVFRQSKFGETATLCDELILQHPERVDLWLLQASAYVGQGQPMQAAQNYEVIDRLGKSTTQTLQALGDIYTNESLWDLALGAYQRVLELDPGQSPDRILRDVEVLAQRNALRQARTLLAAVKRAFSEELDEDAGKRILKLQARLAASEEGGSEAVTALENLVALDPLDGEALILLGQHYAGAGDPEKALFYYERAGALDRFEAEAKLRQAQLLVNQSRYFEAIPLLKRAQELKPRDDVARYLEQVERVARARS